MASVKDTHGNLHKTEMCTWVTGKGRVLWEEPADMSLSVIPEKPSYKVASMRATWSRTFPGSQGSHHHRTLRRHQTLVQVLSGTRPSLISKWSPILFRLLSVGRGDVAACGHCAGAATFHEDGVDLGRPHLPYRLPQSPGDRSLQDSRRAHQKRSGRIKPRDTVKLQLSAAAHAPLQQGAGGICSGGSG